MEQISSSEATSASQAVSHIFETWDFITAFTRSCHLPLSRASWILSTPSYPIDWRFILTLTSHLRLCLSSGLFPSGFPTKTLYACIFSPIRVACTAHFVSLALIIRIIFDERSKSCGSLQMPSAHVIPERLHCQRPHTLLVFPQRKAAAMRHKFCYQCVFPSVTSGKPLYMFRLNFLFVSTVHLMSDFNWFCLCGWLCHALSSSVLRRI